MASNKISILISAQDKASGVVKSASDNINHSAEQIKTSSKIVALATAAMATKIGIDSVRAAGQYESSLSRLQQASGATKDEMKLLGDTAIALGKSNDFAGVSAADAATTMVELSKAGLSVKDTLAAAKGTMALAKAGNIEFSDAAIIAASSLNAFNMEGKDASKVADMLAAGANASQADLSDLAMGLQQSATVAKQFKLGLDENVTALALFANNGIKGSDAGTSLKTMLIALAKPSKESSAAMKDIGFNAYDANGQFVGLREMSSRLKSSLSGLTDEQKQNALATIFGTDAFRAAAVLADNAGDSFDDMSKSVRKSGAAQEAARAQMGPYERSLEGLRNTAADLSLRIGNALLPAVTNTVNFISGSATPAFDTLSGTLSGQIPLLSGLAAGVGAYAFGVGTVTLATKGWALAQGALNLAMRANPVGLLVAGAVGIVTAFVATQQQTDRSTDSTKRLSDARNALKLASDAAKLAEDQLAGAQLSAEGAALSVERAQQTYNDAVAQYGPKSLEAREAAFRLKGAEDELKGANDRVTDATKKKADAESVAAKQRKEVEEAERAKKTVIDNTNGSISGQLRSLGDLKLKLSDLNGKNFSYTVTGNEVASKNAAAGYKMGEWAAKGHALGTLYAPGGRTLVGEHGPEMVNLPQGSQVTQAYRTRSMMQEGGGDGGGITINITGPVSFADRSDIDYFAERIDKTQRLARMGMGS
ncbi:phage tail tape measure protein [Rhodococcus erythropolis]|uniref:phage tail tape measure protein n=1 Tax=Rhodococcus erythropolis TaxID=1833 RepID=UPI003013E332